MSINSKNSTRKTKKVPYRKIIPKKAPEMNQRVSFREKKVIL